MNIKKFFSKNLWIDSFVVAISIIAGIETIFAIFDFKLNEIYCGITLWWEKLIVIFVVFLIVWSLTVVFKALQSYSSISLKIRNIPILIKEGNLFDSRDWKVIPFNEYFDTQVDDVIIAHNSLNGVFIDTYVNNISDLRQVITNAPSIPNLSIENRDGRIRHELGRIITYNSYMLLAFSHFENNQARLNHNQYEACLRTMWKEISRTYANRPITIPLLGGGITRFEGVSGKNESHLLRCILCTLNTSDAQIYQPITICLTKKTIDNINLYDFKKLF